MLCQTREFCPLKLFRAVSPSYTNVSLGEFEAWWIVLGLLDRASTSVTLEKDGNCFGLVEWSSQGSACGRAQCGREVKKVSLVDGPAHWGALNDSGLLGMQHEQKI